MIKVRLTFKRKFESEYMKYTISLVTILIFVSCYPKILRIYNAPSPDMKNTVTIIDSANDGGFDYQLIRYIYLKDTKRILNHEEVNQIVLPDSGGVEVAWENNNTVIIYIEEHGIIYINNAKTSTDKYGYLVFKHFKSNIKIKLYIRSNRLNYDELIENDVRIYKF